MVCPSNVVLVEIDLCTAAVKAHGGSLDNFCPDTPHTITVKASRGVQTISAGTTLLDHKVNYRRMAADSMVKLYVWGLFIC